MKERLLSSERNISSSTLDLGKGKERTWKRFAWKVAGYGVLIAGGLLVLSGL